MGEPKKYGVVPPEELLHVPAIATLIPVGPAYALASVLRLLNVAAVLLSVSVFYHVEILPSVYWGSRPRAVFILYMYLQR